MPLARFPPYPVRSVPDVQPSGCHPPSGAACPAPPGLGIRDEMEGVCGAPEAHPPYLSRSETGLFLGGRPIDTRLT